MTGLEAIEKVLRVHSGEEFRVGDYPTVAEGREAWEAWQRIRVHRRCNDVLHSWQQTAEESERELARLRGATGPFLLLVRERGLGRFMPDELSLLAAMAQALSRVSVNRQAAAPGSGASLAHESVAGPESEGE